MNKIYMPLLYKEKLIKRHIPVNNRHALVHTYTLFSLNSQDRSVVNAKAPSIMRYQGRHQYCNIKNVRLSDSNFAFVHCESGALSLSHCRAAY